MVIIILHMCIQLPWIFGPLLIITWDMLHVVKIGVDVG